MCASAGATLLDDATIAAIAASMKLGGEAHFTELVWLTKPDGDAPLASARVQGVRDASGLRRALLFAAPMARAGLIMVCAEACIRV